MKKSLAVLVILLSLVFFALAVETAYARAQSPAATSADQYTRGKAAYDAGDYVAALPLLTGAAEAGDIRAQWYLSVMYEEGRGVPPDHVEALGWHRMVAASEPVPAPGTDLSPWDWLVQTRPSYAGLDGFGGLQWGTYVDDVEDLKSGGGETSARSIVTQAEVKSYRRASDEPKAWSIPIDGPFYHFYQDRLYAAGFGVTSANRISSGFRPNDRDMEEFKRSSAAVAAMSDAQIAHYLSEAERGERIRDVIEGFHPVWGTVMVYFMSLYGEPTMKDYRYNYAYPVSFTAEFGWDFPNTGIRLVFHHDFDTEISHYDNLMRITRKTTYFTARFSSPEIDQELGADLDGVRERRERIEKELFNVTVDDL